MTVQHLRGRATAADVQLGRMVKTLLDLTDTKKRDLAESIGMSPQALSDKMNGRSPWSLGEMDAIANALGVTRAVLQRDPDALLAELIGGSSTGGKTAPAPRQRYRPLALVA
jgi:transcriptional regulator with XRE-family HTH domain